MVHVIIVVEIRPMWLVDVELLQLEIVDVNADADVSVNARISADAGDSRFLMRDTGLVMRLDSAMDSVPAKIARYFLVQKITVVAAALLFYVRNQTVAAGNL